MRTGEARTEKTQDWLGKRTASFLLVLGVCLCPAAEARAATATLGVMGSGGELLDAWIDFNGNGSWKDPGEQVFENQLLLKGMNRLTFRVPAGPADGGLPALFRLTGRGIEGSPLDIVVPFLRNGLRGPDPIDSVAVEPDGQPSPSGTGANVVFASAVEAGGIARVDVTFGKGLLNAWIDFNGNGLWTDPGEQILENQLLVQETSHLEFRVPVDAVEGSTWARFRFHDRTDWEPGGSRPIEGLAPNGGVEDHRLDIGGPFFRDGFESRDLSKWSRGPRDQR